MKVKKPLVLGLTKKEGYRRIIFKKSDDFEPFFSKFLVFCDFYSLDNNYSEIIKTDIEFADNIRNDKYDIDVIITKIKIFVIIRTEENSIESSHIDKWIEQLHWSSEVEH